MASSPNSKLLLSNGTVLQHDEKDNIVVLNDSDILIEHGRIVDIGQSIIVETSVPIIDCRGKIISPGFIDAHHHLWQTQLKGRFGDSTLLDYMIAANLQAINFTPTDMFWGQLGGCMEALDAGTTCVVDNAHMGVSPEHGAHALGATIASGIRAIFCYGVSPVRATEWTADSFELDTSPLPTWLLPQLESLALKGPFGLSGRVQLGFFFDSYFLPPNIIKQTFDQVRSFGIKLITSHFRHWPISTGQATIPEILNSSSLLGPDILLSHGNGVTASQASLLTSSGVYIASTPDAEVFMASGADPVAFREDLPLTCIGADCQSCGPSSMLHQMQVALAATRGAQVSKAFAANRYPRKPKATIQQAFNLSTINAARALGMENDIGSIQVGKLADLILFDATTPAMSCAVEQDPLTAVVRHAGTKEIHTVLVGGRVVKSNGMLKSVNLSDVDIFDRLDLSLSTLVDGKEDLSWEEVSRALTKSRQDIESRINSVNYGLAAAKLGRLMGGVQDLLED